MQKSWISRCALTILAVLVMTSLSGCMTRDPYTGELTMSNGSIGAGLGAATGAVFGAVVSGSPGTGEVVGASMGALVGGAIGSAMDDQAAMLRHQLRDDGVRVVRDGPRLYLVMADDITFKHDSAEIRPRFQDVLQSVALVANHYNNTLVKIAGFASSTGTADYNQALSEQRAYNVQRFLIAQGVNPRRIIARGFGSRYPVANNRSSWGRHANRRVEISLESR